MTRMASCLFCDDVREEVGSKLSIMGVFGGNIISFSGPVPQVMAKLGVVVIIIASRDDIPDEIQIKIYWENGDVVHEGPKTQLATSGPIPSDAKQFHARIVNVISPVAIASSGVLRVDVITPTAVLPAGRLNFQHSDSPE